MARKRKCVADWDAAATVAAMRRANSCKFGKVSRGKRKGQCRKSRKRR